MKEALRMMGLPDLIYHGSWLITFQAQVANRTCLAYVDYQCNFRMCVVRCHRRKEKRPTAVQACVACRGSHRVRGVCTQYAYPSILQKWRTWDMITLQHECGFAFCGPRGMRTKLPKPRLMLRHNELRDSGTGLWLLTVLCPQMVKKDSCLYVACPLFRIFHRSMASLPLVSILHCYQGTGSIT